MSKVTVAAATEDTFAEGTGVVLVEVPGAIPKDWVSALREPGIHYQRATGGNP